MNSSITPFDLHRMFIGDTPPLFLIEIIFRVSLIYTYAVLAMHFLGKRGTSQLTPLEYVLIIALGSAAGDPMFYPNIPIIYAFVVITVVVILNNVLAYEKKRNEIFRSLLESSPKIIIKNGKIIEEILKSEKYSKDQILSRLREKNVRYLEEVDIAIIEESGKLSVFKRSSYKPSTDLTKLN